MDIPDIIKKSVDGVSLSLEEIAHLFKVPSFTEGSAIIQAAGYQKSQQASNGLAVSSTA